MISRKHNSRPGLVLGLLFIAGASLAGCNRDTHDESYGKLDLPVNSSAADDGYSDRFERSLGANPNSEPINVAEGDLRPVDPTKEPVDVR